MRGRTQNHRDLGRGEKAPQPPARATCHWREAQISASKQNSSTCVLNNNPSRTIAAARVYLCEMREKARVALE